MNEELGSVNNEVLQEDWVECTLGEVLALTKVKHKPISIENLFYVGLEHIEKENGRLTTSVRNEEIKTVKNKFEKGQILYGKLRPYFNKVHLASQSGVCSTDILVFQPSSFISSRFALNYVMSRLFVNEMSANMTGVNLPRVSTSIVTSFTFPLPPIPIQKAIVSKIEALFSSLDSGIADLKKAQAQLKTYRQAVLKKAFEGAFTKDWRAAQSNLPTADELLAQIKDERKKQYEQQLVTWKEAVIVWEENGKVGKKPGKPRPLTIPDLPNQGHNQRKWDIPNNWTWTQIGTLCFVTKLAGFEYTDYVSYDANGDLPVLKAENAGTLGFKRTEYSKVKSESVKSLIRSQIFGGELLIVFVGAGTGNVAMVPLNQRYFLGPNIGMARPYFELNSKYLELFLQSAFGKSLMMSAVKAVAQPSLSMGTIRQAPIAFMSKQEQTEIVRQIESRLSVCDKVEQSISESLEKAQALRQSILKKAFEGKLLSKAEIATCKADKDYEPASVLLKKIKAEKAAEQLNKVPVKKKKKTKVAK